MQIIAETLQLYCAAMSATAELLLIVWVFLQVIRPPDDSQKALYFTAEPLWHPDSNLPGHNCCNFV